MAGQLTAKQAAFIGAYLGPAQGVAIQAARLAGYTGTRNSLKVTASRLLKHPSIMSMVREKRAKLMNAKVLSVGERRACLTRIALDATEETKDRLRAIDLLNRMDGLYVFRAELTSRHTLEDLVVGSSTVVDVTPARLLEAQVEGDR